MKTNNLEDKQKNTKQKQLPIISKGSSTSIKALIRVRPLIDIQKNTKQIIKVQQNRILKLYNDEINFIQSKFDYVFDSQKEQRNIFAYIQPSIKQIFQGFNLTIFAYGQTGSGKTFTMFGKDWENLIDKHLRAKKQNTYFQNLDDDNNYAGIIPRSIHADSPNPKPLNIHESKLNGIFVQGLTQFQVDHFVDCLNLMKKGQRNRFIRQTSMNAKSSRSHTIFQITIQSIQSNNSGNFIKARLNLCDLAGSQKINKKQLMVNDHLNELKNINLSLTTLGKVINTLSSGKKSNIAAFRQSKLTRLLQQSLTLNTNTFIIGNVSPSSKNSDQTLNTLKFAERASHITMKVKPLDFNQMNSQSVSKLKKQIQYLKQLLNLKKIGVSDQNILKKLQSKLPQINKTSNNESITQKQFEKLLQQNRKMKKQISILQTDLQKVRSDAHSSFTHRSNISDAEDFLSSNDLRKQIYNEKFLKKKQKLNQSIEKANGSLLVASGKATIDTSDFKLNQNQNKKSWLNRKQKQNILNRIQKLQSIKLNQDSLIMQELQNMKQFSLKKSSPFVMNGKKSYQDPQKSKLTKPNRLHQANVFRKGNNVSLSVQSKQIKYPELQQYPAKNKRKKIDYRDKIQQLEARLYGFK